MKFLNDFKNLFAIVGVVSIIFWTCASESTTDTTNVNPPQLTGGTYQISALSSGALDRYMVALNTETGVIKTYRFNIDWYDVSDFNNPVGVDGNLVLTH